MRADHVCATGSTKPISRPRHITKPSFSIVLTAHSVGAIPASMTDATQPLMIDSFPRAIAHLDGDAFFTSVEQSLNPAYRGRPMVTGKERNIIACASYEAKALGIKRGVALHEAIRICPDLIVLPDDYETYSLVSKRMFNIMRRFTPLVEEHSIDEGFADLTGCQRVHHCSYEEIAQRMKQVVSDRGSRRTCAPDRRRRRQRSRRLQRRPARVTHGPVWPRPDAAARAVRRGRTSPGP